MRFCLINPNWSFEGSIYFGCREPHLPLEFGYAGRLLEISGHDSFIIDGHLDDLGETEIAKRVEEIDPDFVVITTAPSYLFWRCAPPELRVPMKTISALRRTASGSSGQRASKRVIIAAGPHGSTTPDAVLSKLGADAVLLGEFEEILPFFSSTSPEEWVDIPSVCYRINGSLVMQGGPRLSKVAALPALHWPAEVIRRRRHHHHRFDSPQQGAGAEVEASRGCPYSCSFCARENFRGPYRRRPLDVLIEEMDGLIAQGAGYIYFIDEIFLPDKRLLSELARRNIKFGVQTRIELWNAEMLDMLGGAGCVSVEAGVESITEQGRLYLNKRSSLSLQEIAERLIHAKRTISFVQATLLDNKTDSPDEVNKWRRYLHGQGVWANRPVPLFPYPGSPEYQKRWGKPDNFAWERAHAFYLDENSDLSDIQEKTPLPIDALEMERINDN